MYDEVWAPCSYKFDRTTGEIMMILNSWFMSVRVLDIFDHLPLYGRMFLLKSDYRFLFNNKKRQYNRFRSSFLQQSLSYLYAPPLYTASSSHPAIAIVVSTLWYIAFSSGIGSWTEATYVSVWARADRTEHHSTPLPTGLVLGRFRASCPYQAVPACVHSNNGSPGRS